ncbi:hypothetical protein D3C81_1319060 [compost metagenome]
MEVRFGGGAVADPGRGDLGIALDRRGHAPAHRLDELGGEVAGNGEETVFAAGVHDRQLAALERVGLVGEQLADHVLQRVVPRDQDALLAIGREAHVAVLQRHGVGGGDGFLAQALHVERHLLLPLRGGHACVEDARLEHGAQATEQLLAAQLRVPRADGAALFVEHAHQAVGQVAGFRRLDVDGRLAHDAGVGKVQVGEIGLAARPPGGFRYVQTQGCVVSHVASSRMGSRMIGVRDQERTSVAEGGLGGWNRPDWGGADGVPQGRYLCVTSLMVRPSSFVLVNSVYASAASFLLQID